MTVIVDYDAGNVRSVQRACHYVGIDAEISFDPSIIATADRLIFPGVGSAESAVETLRDRGIDEAIKTFYATGKPMLGICLGLQILFEHSEEGNKTCLGIVAGATEKFNFSDRSFKVPHIGWNELLITQQHPMLKNIKSGDEFYFVHSYFVSPKSGDHVLGTTTYGDNTFCSVIGKDNLFATQFHLEKSGELGLKLLSAFKLWDATC